MPFPVRWEAAESSSITGRKWGAHKTRYHHISCWLRCWHGHYHSLRIMHAPHIAAALGAGLHYAFVWTKLAFKSLPKIHWLFHHSFGHIHKKSIKTISLYTKVLNTYKWICHTLHTFAHQGNIALLHHWSASPLLGITSLRFYTKNKICEVRGHIFCWTNFIVKMTLDKHWAQNMPKGHRKYQRKMLPHLTNLASHIFTGPSWVGIWTPPELCYLHCKHFLRWPRSRYPLHTSEQVNK